MVISIQAMEVTQCKVELANTHTHMVKEEEAAEDNLIHMGMDKYATIIMEHQEQEQLKHMQVTKEHMLQEVVDMDMDMDMVMVEVNILINHQSYHSGNKFRRSTSTSKGNCICIVGK